MANKIPYFARNKYYIAKHVFDPADFVVLDHNDIEMELRTDKIPLYEKDDKGSKVLVQTPVFEGLMKVYVESSVTGLNGGNIYWEVRHLEDDNYLTYNQ